MLLSGLLEVQRQLPTCFQKEVFILKRHREEGKAKVIKSFVQSG